MKLSYAWVLTALLANCAGLVAEEAPVNAGTQVEEPTVGGTKLKEEGWNFEPLQGRVDAFADVERRMEIEKDIKDKPDGEFVGPGPGMIKPETDQIEAALKWGQAEADRVDKLILARRWDEAIQACDIAAKHLEKYQEDAGIAALREAFARARHQAVEAKIFEEAQAKFDALGIKVEGILWAPEGSLAVIAQEPRALSINDRTRDCVIVNIDTNRVDFLFNYQQRRFEFQRYVGEEVGPQSGGR